LPLGVKLIMGLSIAMYKFLKTLAEKKFGEKMGDLD
jgi:hypothetical protein